MERTLKILRVLKNQSLALKIQPQISTHLLSQTSQSQSPTYQTLSTLSSSSVEFQIKSKMMQILTGWFKNLCLLQNQQLKSIRLSNKRIFRILKTPKIPIHCLIKKRFSQLGNYETVRRQLWWAKNLIPLLIRASCRRVLLVHRSN